MDAEERAHLEEILNILNSNRRQLEKQAVQYGTEENAPLNVQNQLKAIRGKIDQIKQQLDDTIIISSRPLVEQVVQGVLKSFKFVDTYNARLLPFGNVSQDVQVKLPGLNYIDEMVLRVACEATIQENSPLIDSEVLMKQGSNPLIDSEALLKELQGSGVQHADLIETIEILEREEYILPSKPLGTSNLFDFQVTSYGLEQYARNYLPGYEELREAVGRILIRGRSDGSAICASDIAQEIGHPLLLVEHIIKDMANAKLVTIHEGGHGIYVLTVSMGLRRRSKEGSE